MDESQGVEMRELYMRIGIDGQRASISIETQFFA